MPPSTFFTLVLAGLWLMSAPATFHFESIPLIWSDTICGVLIIALALLARTFYCSSILWTLTLIGVWLQFAPLAFWAPTAGAYVNNVIIGVLVITLSSLLFPMPHQIPDDEPSIPPGWTYNPSSWPQRLPVVFFAFICWMISKYLAAMQLGYIDTVWDPFFDPGTEAVLTSDVAQFFPVSDAGLGAFAYTLEVLSTCIGGKSRWRTSPCGVFIFGILSVPASIVSTILVILQPVAVGTWCTLCLLTAVCMLVIIPLALDEVVASWQYLKMTPPKKRLSVFFKGGLCPKAVKDTRTPPLTASFTSLIRASLWGVTFPWHFCIAMLCGILLMILPSLLSIQGALFDLDPIVGALSVIILVGACSEWTRSCRFLTLIPAVLLAIVAIYSQEHVLIHLALAIAIGWLSIPKGSIHERKNY